MSDELPQGWTITSLAELLTTLESGSRPRGGVRGIAKGVPSIGGEHLNYTGGFNFDSVKYVPKTFAAAMTKGRIQRNDILVVKDGATTGKTAFVDSRFPFDEAFVNEHVFICRPTKEIEPQFLFRFLTSMNGQERILENFKGSAQGGINQTFAPNTEVPLAPLAEQRRIVAKLEQQLGKVDACQQRLTKIPVLLKRFRQSVLAAACSGRLTADWRDKNPNVGSGHEFLRQLQHERRKLWEKVQLQKMAVGGRMPSDDNWKRRYREPTLGSIPDRNALPPTWTWERLDAVLAYIEAGKSFTCEERPPLENEVGVLKVSAVTWGEFDEKQSKTCKEERRINSDIQVRPGDFLFSRANTIELVGSAVIVKRVSSKLMLSDKTLRLQLAGTPKEFVLHSLKSPAGRAEIESLATGNQNSMRNIGQDRIRDIVIPFPPLAEQQEIVRRVEGLFALADQIEARFAQARAQVEKLTPSLLARAFRGELVPQDPNDEPVSELLKRIHEQRNGSSTNKLCLGENEKEQRIA